jgi:hypothetical protein
MAQTYTIEEAAGRLGIGQDELKRRLREDWKSIRSFRDGPTLRFRASDIDDLARTLGQTSDPGLQPGQRAATGSDEFLTPPAEGSSEELIFGSKKTKKPGDSDIRLDGSTGPKLDTSEHQLTEEISLDVSGPGSSKMKGPGSDKLLAPKSSKIPGAKEVMTNTDSSSEFELSLDSDSDSFELDLNTGSGEKAPLAGKAGLSLDKPTDKGVNLGDSDDSMEFELSIDQPPAKSKAALRTQSPESDSEFELALDDNSGVTDGIAASMEEGDDAKGDIFETDFDLPAVGESESGSEVVAVEDSELENSDFDIALDESDVQVDDEESASQVVLIDDEEEAPPVKGRRGKALAGAAAAAAALSDDSDETGSASKALRGVRSDDDDDAPVRVVQAATPKWGALPVVMASLSIVPIFLGLLMGFEAIRGMTGYNPTSKPAAPILKGIAGMLGMAPNEGK